MVGAWFQMDWWPNSLGAYTLGPPLRDFEVGAYACVAAAAQGVLLLRRMGPHAEPPAGPLIYRHQDALSARGCLCCCDYLLIGLGACGLWRLQSDCMGEAIVCGPTISRATYLTSWEPVQIRLCLVSTSTRCPIQGKGPSTVFGCCRRATVHLEVIEQVYSERAFPIQVPLALVPHGLLSIPMHMQRRGWRLRGGKRCARFRHR